MLFVTLHGGKPDDHPGRNNVQAYDKNGARVERGVLGDEPGVVLDGGFLYVVNANRTQNSLLCYRGSGTSYQFVSTFVSQRTCEGIVHPFDFTFDGAGHCYVSSQDTNLVTRLAVSSDGKVGTPAAVAPALAQFGAGRGAVAAMPAGSGQAREAFPPGTFVASAVAGLGELPATAVPAPQGLAYADEAAKKHSVRGVLWANDALYVVDQPAGRVKVYDADGKFLGQSNEVETPVHVLVHDGSLCVTGANHVLTAKLAKPAGDFTLKPIPGVKIKNAGGMAFTKEGNVYVASRTERVILKFDSSFKQLPFNCTLPDDPEFLLHV